MKHSFDDYVKVRYIIYHDIIVVSDWYANFWNYRCQISKNWHARYRCLTLRILRLPSHRVQRSTLMHARGRMAIADRLVEKTRVVWPLPLLLSRGDIIKQRTAIVFSCNWWWNWKRFKFNSLTWSVTYTTRRYTRIFVHRARRLHTWKWTPSEY